MKVIMYGAEICPDCVEAKAELEKYTAVRLDYRDITKSTTTLKEFLAYRDFDEMFAQIKKDGKIGIPFFILEDGTKTLDVYDFLETEKPVKTSNSCSIDGKGNC